MGKREFKLNALYRHSALNCSRQIRPLAKATATGCNLDYSVPQNPLVYAPPNNCYQGSISTYYIKVQAISDIQAALAFSNKTKVPLTIKNSGHDYKGRSSAPNSLALWTHNVQPALKLTKNFIPDGCSAAAGDGVTMGAGQAFLGLFQFAEANNITIVGGSSETVGAAGGVCVSLLSLMLDLEDVDLPTYHMLSRVYQCLKKSSFLSS